MVKALTEYQILKLRENYKPGENIVALGRKYKVSYITIRRALGELYQPSKMAKAAMASKEIIRTKTPDVKGEYHSQRMIIAASINQKATKYFNSVKVGDNFKMYIRDSETLRTKYILVSGTVTQKTDNLIFVGRQSVSKDDIMEYIAYKERRVAG